MAPARSSEPRPTHRVELGTDWLRSAAVSLHDACHDRGGPTRLVGVVAPGSAGAAPQLELDPLTGPDPVEQLLGVVAPRRWRAVGIVTGARITVEGDPDEQVDGPFVHLLDRSGTSVTRLQGGDGEPMLLGPSAQVVEGRVADACRRMLGLPTAPPPDDTTSFIVDVWLARVIELATDVPRLSWREVVGLHSARPSGPCTPAQLADRTRRTAESLSWSDIRQGFVEGAIEGLGVDSCIAAWMDDGMLARWVLGTGTPTHLLLELVDALLSPGVSDLVAATVGMCPSSGWPAADTPT